MNARSPLHSETVLPPPGTLAGAPQDDTIDLLEYWDIIVDNRWLVATITAVALALGGGYALLVAPVYESNLLIQVEDSAGSAKSFLGEAASLFDVKTEAASEIEILRSRTVIGTAVDNTLLYIDARPRYLPLVGNWLARKAHHLSDPGFLGFGGFVTGTERITVSEFTVPEPLEGTRFRVIALGGGRYSLTHPVFDAPIVGRVGTPVQKNTPAGMITLLVSDLEGKPGAEFTVVRRSRLATIQYLQGSLKIAEKGRQSGIIDATLQSTDPQQMTAVLNELGRQYVRQNVERKAAEAEKMLSFLKAQLPQFKKQLDRSEEAYSRYRNKEGTVAMDEEARLALRNSVDLNEKLLDAQQKRAELVSRFTSEHPAVKTLDAQVSTLRQALAAVEARIRAMPTVQQDALRLERDAKLNNEAYQSMRNNELQLQLIREGKVGNVRLIDEAILPEHPVKPNRLLVLAAAATLGLLGGIVTALARTAMFRGIRNPQEIEGHTGLGVYSTIPLSPLQEKLARDTTARQPGLHLLSLESPQDPAVESLRSLRTALQFAMIEAPNNRVLVTGATPGVGKSFISANFAAVVASAGKRVLLVDADMRKGHLNQYFGVDRRRGLSELIAGSTNSADAIRKGLIPNLDLITTGVLPPNPAELMMSSAFERLLQELSPQYDLVILDTPPVLVAADSVGVAPHAGTVLLVARAELSQVGDVRESAKRLAQAGGVVAGVLFNAMDLSRRHYGSYGYRYGGYRYRQYRYEPTLH